MSRKGKQAEAAETARQVPAIAVRAHPHASRAVRRFKAATGLAGFVLGAWLAHGAGLPAFDVLLRALLVGIGARVAGWALAVMYWRVAILAELDAARARREAALEAARDAADRVMRETAAATAPQL